MVTAQAVLGKELFCMEWKNERKLAIFDLSGQFLEDGASCHDWEFEHWVSIWHTKW